MQISVRLAAVILTSAAIVGTSTADRATARTSAKKVSGKLTKAALQRTGTKAAIELIDNEWTDNDFGLNIIDRTGTCKLTGSLRGTCSIEYEFDDGSFCDDTVRVAKRSLKSSKISYRSDSEGEDGEFESCTEPTETDPDETDPVETDPDYTEPEE